MTPTHDEFYVRPATAADLPEVGELLLAQQRDHHLPTPIEHLRQVAARTLADPALGMILVAASSAGLCGVAYVSYATPMEHRGEVAWLEELFVRPGSRGRGVGRRLLDAVCAAADARGCVAVDLEVDDDHRRAEHLYHSAGFRSLRRVHWTRPLSAWDWER